MNDDVTRLSGDFASIEADAFTARLGSGAPMLIDGGLATQCEAMGYNIDGDLWSATLLRSNPRAIVDAHRAYLDAGAEIITTASYQASKRGFMSTGLSARDATELIVSSVDLAAQARDEYLRDNAAAEPVPLIAASVGPYGAFLHDGSEYTGRYGVTKDELREFHQDRLELLDQSGADLLACETIPSYEEAAVLAELLNGVTNPAWVSFSCRDENHISDGTLIADAAGLFHNHRRVLAVGANCTAPDLINPIIEILKSAIPGIAIVVYPNSGETYHANDNSWSGAESAKHCKALAQEWLEAGATLIGGCCRLGPKQIAAMAMCPGLNR